VQACAEYIRSTYIGNLRHSMGGRTRRRLDVSGSAIPGANRPRGPMGPIPAICLQPLQPRGSPVRR